MRQEGRGRRRSEAFGAVSSLATVASSNGGGCTSLQLGELDERYVYSSNGTRVVAGRVAGAQSRRSRRSANFPSVANKRHLRGFGYYESSSFLPPLAHARFRRSVPSRFGPRPNRQSGNLRRGSRRTIRKGNLTSLSLKERD